MMEEEPVKSQLLSRILAVEQNQLKAICAHAEQGYPHEVVGILAGSREKHIVTKVHLLINERAETKNRYKVGPLKLMRAEQALEAQGYEILGYYHSHPDHPARYSGYDKEHALPNMSYLIVSVMEGFAKEIQSWRLREDRCAMDEERIESLFSSKSDEVKI